MNREFLKLMTDEDILEGMKIRLEREGFREKTVSDLLGGARKILDASTREQLAGAVFADEPEKAIRPLIDELFPYLSFNKIGWYGVALRIMGDCLRKIASNELDEDDKKRLAEIAAEEKKNAGQEENSISDNDEKTEKRSSIAAKKAARRLQLPFPKEADAYDVLYMLKHDPDVAARNAALKDAVEKAGKENKDFDAVLSKVSVLISICGPNGTDKENIARQIVACRIDEYMQNGSAEAVDILTNNLSDRNKHDFYMFAVRYCAAHYPELYPYYNPATVRAMKFCRDNHGFYNFSNDELLHYSKYKKLLAIFREKYSLEAFSLSEISWILTYSGKLLAGK